LRTSDGPEMLLQVCGAPSCGVWWFRWCSVVVWVLLVSQLKFKYIDYTKSYFVVVIGGVILTI